jgi:hypothetical protein
MPHTEAAAGVREVATVQDYDAIMKQLAGVCVGGGLVARAGRATGLPQTAASAVHCAMHGAASGTAQQPCMSARTLNTPTHTLMARAPPPPKHPRARLAGHHRLHSQVVRAM